MGAEPDQMRIEARELVKEDTHPLRTLGDLQLQKLFDREAVGEVIGHRTKVVDAVRERNHLLVELRLAGFLDAGVKIPNVRDELHDGFTIDFKHNAQDTMG